MVRIDAITVDGQKVAGPIVALDQAGGTVIVALMDADNKPIMKDGVLQTQTLSGKIELVPNADDLEALRQQMAGATAAPATPAPSAAPATPASTT